MAVQVQENDCDRECVSSSLLEDIVVGPVPRRFSPGMDEYLSSEAYLEEPAPKKRKRLSLPKRESAGKENKAPCDSSSRFCASFADASERFCFKEHQQSNSLGGEKL